MKIYDIFEGDVIPFRGKSPTPKEKTPPKEKTLADRLIQPPEQQALIDKLISLTVEEFGPYMMQMRSPPGPPMHFLLWDNYWETYLHYPSEDDSILTAKSKRLVQSVKKKTGMSPSSFTLEMQTWRDEDDADKRYFKLKIFFSSYVPQLQIDLD